MTISWQSRPFGVGVDTHARNHVYAIVVPTTGALIDTRSFPVTAGGINPAIAWVARRTDADADTLWVIEGAASYGASLAGAATAHRYTVAEAPRMNAKDRHGIGKTMPLMRTGSQRPRWLCWKLGCVFPERIAESDQQYENLSLPESP